MFTRHVYFIRHGEYKKTYDNKTQLLTELGQTQALKTGQILTQKLKRPIFIYSSDLTRAKQTTEILMTNLREHDPVLTYNDVFQEVGFNSRYPYIPTDFHQFIVSLFIYFWNYTILCYYHQNEAYYKRAINALKSILTFNQEHIWYENEATCIYVCHKNLIQFLIAR